MKKHVLLALVGLATGFVVPAFQAREHIFGEVAASVPNARIAAALRTVLCT
jgi:hypothetical protein